MWPLFISNIVLFKTKVNKSLYTIQSFHFDHSTDLNAVSNIQVLAWVTWHRRLWWWWGGSCPLPCFFFNLCSYSCKKDIYFFQTTLSLPCNISVWTPLAEELQCSCLWKLCCSISFERVVKSGDNFLSAVSCITTRLLQRALCFDNWLSDPWHAPVSETGSMYVCAYHFWTRCTGYVS